MSTTVERRDYILNGLQEYEVAARAMMGEYVVYCEGKVVGGIYDNKLLVKPTESAKRILCDAEYIVPYEGSKPLLFVEKVDDKRFVGELLSEMAKELPLPKKKKA